MSRINRTPTLVIAVGAAVVWLFSAGYMLHFGASWHLDLRVYRSAGDALRHGGSPFTGLFTANKLPFTYTPFALLALTPLSFGALGAVEALWWAVSAVCLVGVAVMMLKTAFVVPAGRAWALAALICGVSSLALEPVRSNFNYGQVNLILMAMIVADLTLVRTSVRGLLIGLAAAIKLTPLVYLLYFVVAKEWRSLVRGLVVFAGVTAISWAVLPSDSARYWFHEAFDARRTGLLGTVSNQSWNGMVHRPPFHSGHLGTAVWLVLAGATLVCGAVLTRWLIEGARTAEAIMVLALTEVLVSPVSWTHHWSWLAVTPIVAAGVWRRHRSVGVALLVLLSLGVAAPYLWIRVVPLSYLTSNSLVLGGAAVLGIWLQAEARLRRQPAGAQSVEEEPHVHPVEKMS